MKIEAPDEIRVWDLAIRSFHWLLVGSFALAYLTEDEWPFLHTNAGYVIAGLIGFRLIWGLVGTRHARFSDFVRGPAAVRDYLKAALRFRAPRHLGHNPAGGAMVIALLATLTLTVLSGMALYGTTDFTGPLAGVFRGRFAADLLEGAHELGANLTLFLVALHVAGVLLTSLEHRENLVTAMITGRKKENSL